MKRVEKVLLARRITDHKFLRLEENTWTTSFDFVDEPALAKRIYPLSQKDLRKPKEASFYFENSQRAKEVWLKDCIMVPYKIKTKIKVKEINIKWKS